MPNWFYSMPIYSALVAMFVTCNAISLFGNIVSQSFLLKVDNKDVVTKVVWQTILFFSTIFITFWIATNWGNLGNLKLTTIHEANSIAQLYNDLDSLDDSSRYHLERKLVLYLDLVIDDEYPKLMHGEASYKTYAAYRDLVSSIYTYTPRHQLADELRYNRILAQLDQLSNYRESRISFVNGNLQGPLLFFFLSMVAIGCFWTGFIHTRSMIFTLFIIMSQNVIISSSSWLILEMDKPFQGKLSVDDSAFVNIREELRPFLKKYDK